MFISESGTLIIKDKTGGTIARFDTEGFYPYRTARIKCGLALFTRIDFSYKGESEGDNHRVYRVSGGYVACSDSSVAIATEVTETRW